MTLFELKETLARGGIPDPETDALLLLTHVFGITNAACRADPNKDYDSPALHAAVKRRLRREPLQHILGEVWFYDEKYEVSADCLIPRADTELLVEEAIRLLPPNAHFADLCTGSGCIAVSVCAHRKDLRATAVDISEAALAIAARNAEKNGVRDRISFLHDDLLTPHAADRIVFDAILSNPPYIPTEVVGTLAPELAFEPSIALDGGADGLVFYRALLRHFHAPLFLFEIGYDQKEAILLLAKQHGYDAKVCRDLGGNDRLAVLTRS